MLFIEMCVYCLHPIMVKWDELYWPLVGPFIDYATRNLKLMGGKSTICVLVVPKAKTPRHTIYTELSYPDTRVFGCCTANHNNSKTCVNDVVYTSCSTVNKDFNIAKFAIFRFVT